MNGRFASPASAMERSSDLGFNQLELLLFRLQGERLFGINVFKVREIIRTPAITPVPHSDPRVLGLATLRDLSISMIDLGRAIGLPPVDLSQPTFTLVTEFNHRMQGFVVRAVERIAYLSWHSIALPPPALAEAPYLTAVARLQGHLIQIIDVERVMAELVDEKVSVSSEMLNQTAGSRMADHFVLGVDDSAIARRHLQQVFTSLGVQHQVVKDGLQALQLLQQWAEEGAQSGRAVSDRVLMVISDVEMPEMDGYHLVQAIRRDPRLRDLYVVLNSSLSSQANLRFAERAGADCFFTKWSADELSQLILDRVHAVSSASAART